MSKTNEITFRDYRADDREWVASMTLRHYRTNEGFNAEFDAAVAEALDLLERQASDAGSSYIIAEAEGCRIGCIFFSADTGEAGRVRLFYLDERYRGRGIGRRMLNGIIEHALVAGFGQVRVSTFDRHAEACRLYASLGFRHTAREPSMAFGQTMRQVDFVLDLPGVSR